ncbi:MAG: GNAT family N-acetyltransferase [bacterium]|nr:GNAT family N-acetyltransferase [bacterium]
MGIIYKENEIPRCDAFFRLYESTGWNKEYQLTAEEIHRCIPHSWYMVSVYDSDSLVGFGRVLSDGKMHALITEMIVLPEYQGQGIGKQILKYLTDQCLSHQIRDIQLFSAKGKVGFYEKYGYKKRPDSGPGMEIKFNKK